MTPPWLPLPTTLPGRELTLHVVKNALEAGSMIGLGGEPGVGKTTLAGAVARASGRPILAVSFAGCVTADDAVLALGAAAGTRPCGDELATMEALRSQPRMLIIVDDVANEAALGPVERLLGAIPESRALAISETPLLPRHIEVGDASGAAPGDAGMARLVEALGAESVEAALAGLPPEVSFLAAFPMGLPAGATVRLPAAILVPDLHDRIRLRRVLAARVAPGPIAATEGLRRALQPLLDLARGSHLSRPPDPRDALLLRALGDAAVGDAARCEWLAAEARCLAVLGQPEAAGACLASAPSSAGFASVALLSHARAELAFSLGDSDSAWTNALSAAEALGSAGDPAGRAMIWRRAAERLAERGEVERADEAWRRARQASRLLGDEGGLAAAMRGAAALALSRGEWVGASALHEEAAEASPPPGERLNLRLGELSLALVRGEAARIRRGLDLLEETAQDDSLLRANLCRRRADALLRQGDLDGARAAADECAALYAGLGEVIARGAGLRLGADIAALAGRYADAAARYEKALRQQVRARDWNGLVHTLDHAAILHDAGGNPERARMLRDQRVGAQRARGAA